MSGPDSPWAIALVALPLVSAVVTIVAGRRLLALTGLATSAGIVAGAVALTHGVLTHGPSRYRLGGWGAPVGIDLHVDGLAALMVLMTAVVGAAVSVYATAYFSPQLDGHAGSGEPDDVAHERQYFWPLWLFLWASLNALFLSGDAFNLYVTLELVTLAGVALVALAGSTAAMTAAMRYLVAALVGSLLYLLGVTLAYASGGVLDIVSLGRLLPPGGLSSAAVALITSGLMLKTALFPLHFWLPSAHANAPAPVSAVLSGLVVTASFYLLLRLWFSVFEPLVTPGAGVLLTALGAAAILWGSLQALVAVRLKLLVAYSTVAQLGYLFLVFGLAGGTQTGFSAWSATALYAVSHAGAKAALFLASGSLMAALGHDRIAEITGLGGRYRMTLLTMGLASVTLMGLPPSGAFVAKWLLVEAALDRGHWWLAAVIVAGGLLAAAYLFRVLGRAFLAPAAVTEADRAGRPAMEWTALALAGLALVLGLAALPAFDLLRVGAPAFAAGSEAAP